MVSKEKKLSYQRNWRKKNRNSVIYKAQKIIDGMRRRSRVKGLSYPEFTKKEIERILTEGKCCKTGIKFDLGETEFKNNPFCASPDRIDSSLGYTKENTQWVCWIYNQMKGEYTEEILNRFIKNLKGDF